MNKKRLFEYLKSQDNSMLLELLNLAYDAIDTNQRHDVFGKIIIEIPPSPVNGKKLWTTIQTFHEKSMSGYYYAPFDINSKNFSDIPEETDAWFDEIGDCLEDCSRLTDQGDHEMAVQCFKMLHELIDVMEDGDKIVFADEYGTWMIAGNEKWFVKSYLTSLSKVSTPEEFTIGAIPLIKRDSYESLHNKVYSAAIKIGTKEQTIHLKREVLKQKIKTK
jgi:hypothetical protein